MTSQVQQFEDKGREARLTRFGHVHRRMTCTKDVEYGDAGQEDKEDL